MLYVLLLVSIVFGVLRFIVPVSGAINPADVFKDLAHIWVGILIGVAVVVVRLANAAAKEREQQEKNFAVLNRAWFMIDEVIAICLIPIALTVLEVVAFIIRRN